MLEGSVLLGIAQKPDISAVYAESMDRQIDWFKQTLTKLEEFLDTGDLPQLTPDSLSIIKTDLLDIINGCRKLATQPSSELFRLVRSLDMILENLRSSRDVIFTAEGMFDGASIRDEKREEFFSKMRACRKSIAEGLKAFK